MSHMHSTLPLLRDFSLEMTGKDVASLTQARHAIPAGTSINITYLAHEDLDSRLRAARTINQHDWQPVPHIAARRLGSQADLEIYLAELQEVDASKSIFVVGGDPATPEGPYDSALAIISSRLLSQAGVRHVSVSGYPEGHPYIGDTQLWRALHDKQDALADQGLTGTIITQFGFDIDCVLRWLEDVRRRGIDLPVRIGVPGPAGVRRLLSYARRFGVATSANITVKYGFSLTNLLDTAGPHDFITELARRTADGSYGEVRLHFYTFGGIRATAEWMREYLESI